MADANSRYSGQQVAVSSGGFVPITAKIDCDLIGIYNTLTVDVQMRTDSADATTELIIHPGQWKQVGEASAQSGVHPGRNQVRFTKGTNICFVQTVSSSGNLYVEFLR